MSETACTIEKNTIQYINRDKEDRFSSRGSEFLKNGTPANSEGYLYC